MRENRNQVNLGIGRVQNITANNIFQKEKSLYQFVLSAQGKNYVELAEYCDSYYEKNNNGKYFGQITTPINLLGLIQTDSNGCLVNNGLLDFIINSHNVQNIK